MTGSVVSPFTAGFSEPHGKSECPCSGQFQTLQEVLRRCSLYHFHPFILLNDSTGFISWKCDYMTPDTAILHTTYRLNFVLTEQLNNKSLLYRDQVRVSAYVVRVCLIVPCIFQHTCYKRQIASEMSIFSSLLQILGYNRSVAEDGVWRLQGCRHSLEPTPKCSVDRGQTLNHTKNSIPCSVLATTVIQQLEFVSPLDPCRTSFSRYHSGFGAQPSLSAVLRICPG